MKRLITIFSVVLTTLSTFAVTHANKWSVLSTVSDAFQTSGSIRTYSKGMDTIINDVCYFQVEGYCFRYNDDSSRIYVHMDENMLKQNYLDSAFVHDYMIGNEILYLAYDVQEKDTLYTIALPFLWVRCNVVKKVTEDNGRRRVEVQYLCREIQSHWTDKVVYKDNIWLEGIGSLDGLYCYPFDAAPVISGTLMCASHDDELLYREREETAKSIYNKYGIISPCHDESVIKEDALDEIIKQDILPDAICTVYSAGGTAILTNITKADAVALLTSGLYILHTTTAIEKIVIP